MPLRWRTRQGERLPDAAPIQQVFAKPEASSRRAEPRTRASLRMGSSKFLHGFVLPASSHVETIPSGRLPLQAASRSRREPSVDFRNNRNIYQFPLKSF
ncbi:MAG TPA: hypothetical protein VMA37_02410 [Acetobacteraceae bacterium]|nr:hypothetical protein [Acetobacteraceae bacterium]